MVAAWLFVPLAVCALVSTVDAEISTLTLSIRDPTRPSHKTTFDVAFDRSSGAAAPAGVVAFAHGFGIGADHYAFVSGALVPLGFVVAFPHAAGAPSSKNLALDQAFITQYLVAQGANASSVFHGRTVNRTALMGHSLGGGTSLLGADNALLLGRYPPPHAVATLSLGTYTVPNALKSAPAVPASTPALLLTATQDCIDPPAKNSAPVLASLPTGCAALVSVVGGSHCQFAAADAGCAVTEKLCGARPNVSREAQQSTAMRIVAPWLQRVLSPGPDDDALPWGGAAFARVLNASAASGQVQVLGSRWGTCP